MEQKELPDFSPYDKPLDLPITGPISCDLCHRRAVTHIAHLSFGNDLEGKKIEWVGFGCSACVQRWLVGPMRQVTYAGRTPEELAAEQQALIHAVVAQQIRGRR